MLASKLDELPKEKLRDYVKRMKEQAGRVEYLLHSLKSFNLFDTQEPRRVRVETFMKNFLPLLAVAYEKQGIRLETDIAPEADWMYVDARALQHVLLNVLTNASEALTGRGDPCVAITIIRERDRIRFDVEDNGPGIPPERLKQVFLPFYTTKKDGTGLGLVIVQKMLTRMNGTIGLESRDGGGTTAVITVPADDGGRTGGRGDATAVPRGREESEA
jgi:C4-dicarboxylate-specific signal transduction histidine kinase